MPVISARGLAEKLPAGLHAAFGGDPAPFEFSFRRLYRIRPAPPASVVTEEFARPAGQGLKLDLYDAAFAKDVRQGPRPCRWTRPPDFVPRHAIGAPRGSW